MNKRCPAPVADASSQSQVLRFPNLCDLCGLAVKFFPSLVFLGALVVDLSFNPVNGTLRQPEDGPTVPTCRFDVLRIFPRKRKEQ